MASVTTQSQKFLTIINNPLCLATVLPATVRRLVEIALEDPTKSLDEVMASYKESYNSDSGKHFAPDELRSSDGHLIDEHCHGTAMNLESADFMVQVQIATNIWVEFSQRLTDIQDGLCSIENDIEAYKNDHSKHKLTINWWASELYDLCFDTENDSLFSLEDIRAIKALAFNPPSSMPNSVILLNVNNRKLYYQISGILYLFHSCASKLGTSIPKKVAQVESKLSGFAF